MKYQPGDIVEIDPIALRDAFERNEMGHSFEENTSHERSIWESEDGTFLLYQSHRSYSMGEWGYESTEIGEGLQFVIIDSEGSIPYGIHPDIFLAPLGEDGEMQQDGRFFLWEDELDACIIEDDN